MVTPNLDIRIMLEEKRITQRDIAKFLNVRHETVNRWLRDKNLKSEYRDKLIFAINYLYQQKKSGRNRNTERVQA